MQQRLADELKRLRREHRIGSQEELATLSGVSATTIKKLETESVKEVRPSTLRLLAQAFAKDFEGHIDAKRREALYARLMQAAGFLPDDARPAEPTISREALIEEIARETGQQDFALALSSVVYGDGVPESYRRVIMRAFTSMTRDAAHDAPDRAD